ncbi:hypothetical protein ABI59_01385 [Acidobacteria bacterium Mor1]|nr:hypothetical protein ABI59_01385 [Acidobacteria bacterium Mor1]
MLIIGGMHRSGTSMTAGWLKRCGLSLGQDLIPGDWTNPRGHFEDREVSHFQRAILSAAGVDHYLTGSDPIPVAPEFHQQGRELITRRSGHAQWGFKDPRSALLLDFWRELLPEARYLFVFRHYGLVVQSLLRRQRTPKAHVLQVSRFAKVWKRYNEDLLRFHAAHPEDCLMVEVFDLLGCSLNVIEHANERWGFQLRPLDIKDVAEDRLLTRDGPLWFDGLCRMTTRGLDPVYERLQEASRESLQRIGHAARLAG